MPKTTKNVVHAACIICKNNFGVIAAPRNKDTLLSWVENMNLTVEETKQGKQRNNVKYKMKKIKLRGRGWDLETKILKQINKM